MGVRLARREGAREGGRLAGRTGSGDAAPRGRFGSWLAAPLASFHLVVTVSLLLTVLGLVMVLSASSVEAYTAGGSAYTTFTQQVLFTVLGAILFYVALRMPVAVVRRASFPAMIVAGVLLVAVLIPGLGVKFQGARRWFQIAGVSVQPSEIMKVVLVVWGAHLLASRMRQGAGTKELLIPLVPVSVLVFGLVVLEPNLSTTIALGIIVLALLWFAGLPGRLFAAICGAGGAAALVLAFSAGYRSARIQSFLNPGSNPLGKGYQAQQAKFSLAGGGIFGRGLGQSRAKWNYLPNAHNDFIFAIIGEELGLVGCVVVVGLFALFAYVGMRIAMRSVDPFLRLLTATATVWTISQAFINIGYVVGLLPVTGLQLPLISSGGSSTAMTLLMFGLIANAARHEPEAIAALQAGKEGRFWRLLRLPTPQPYSPRHPYGAEPSTKARPRPRQAARVPSGARTTGRGAVGARGDRSTGSRAGVRGTKPPRQRMSPADFPGDRAGRSNAARPWSAAGRPVPPTGVRRDAHRGGAQGTPGRIPKRGRPGPIGGERGRRR